MSRNRNHSHFTGIPDKMRVNAREAAVTIAQQNLRSVDGDRGAPNTQPIPDARAGHRGEPGAPAGTNNGKGLGTSHSDGVELMSRAIANRTKSQGIKKGDYKLPLPAHGWRGGGERGDNEERPVSPRRGRPRGKHYSDGNRPT